jgi:hypothetical protein
LARTIIECWLAYARNASRSSLFFNKIVIQPEISPATRLVRQKNILFCQQKNFIGERKIPLVIHEFSLIVPIVHSKCRVQIRKPVIIGHLVVIKNSHSCGFFAVAGKMLCFFSQFSIISDHRTTSSAGNRFIPLKLNVPSLPNRPV